MADQKLPTLNPNVSYSKNIKMYLQREHVAEDPAHPYISPLYGDLADLPPLLLFAGEDETLCDDAVRFAEKAEKAGVDVTLRIGEGMFHCYPAMAPLFPEAAKALQEISAFIRKHIGS